MFTTLHNYFGAISEIVKASWNHALFPFELNEPQTTHKSFSIGILHVWILHTRILIVRRLATEKGHA